VKVASLGEMGMASIEDILEHAMRFSQEVCGESYRGGELSKYGS